MKQIPKNLSRLLMAILVAAITLGGATSCKSKKKLAAEQSAQKISQAKKDLNAIIEGTSGLTLGEQRQKVAAIKAENYDDPQVQKLITLAEKEIDFQQAELDRKAEEERLRKEEEARILADQSKYSVINSQLAAIANASSIDAANNEISNTLQQFSSPDVPVLIIISQVDGINDYDRPTTVVNFLNLLKDTKKYNYKVASVERDSMGKITQMELLKKW